MIRLFKVYYPLRTLVLLAGEALIIWASFVLGTMLRNQDSWILLNVEGGYAKILAVTCVVLFGCAAERIVRRLRQWPAALRIIFPVVAVVPYGLASLAQHTFAWRWFVLYAALPVAIAWLLEHAGAADPEKRGDWRDFFILLLLGLAVDLRWFDAAWPPGQRVQAKPWRSSAH